MENPGVVGIVLIIIAIVFNIWLLIRLFRAAGAVIEIRAILRDMEDLMFPEPKK